MSSEHPHLKPQAGMPDSHKAGGAFLWATVLVATIVLSACDGAGSNNQPEPSSTPTESAVPASVDTQNPPNLGAASAAPNPSVFDTLAQRTRTEYAGPLNPAQINAEVTGLSIAVLLDGPLLPEPAPALQRPYRGGSGLGALDGLPPFQSTQRRATWPELYAASTPLVNCEQGSLTRVLVEDVPSDARPYLDLHFSTCQTGSLQIDGHILIERPANAVMRPMRIGYDALQLATDTQLTRVTGTLVWQSGDDCGVGERRSAQLLATDIHDGFSVLLNGLDSYTTAPSVLYECGDAHTANGWQGDIALGPFGVVSVDTPTALTHGWDGITRSNSDEILFGTQVPADGLLQIKSASTTETSIYANLTLDDVDTNFPQSTEAIAVQVRLLDGTGVSEVFMATTGDTRDSGLSRLTDTDQDRLPDSWELIHGLDPDDPADATTDLDNDGSSNLDEYLALRNPADSRDQTDN